MTHAHPGNCPICGSSGSLNCAEHLGEDGDFYVCEEPGGCGTSFIVTPDGKCQDFF